MKTRSAILMSACVLLLTGASCGELFDTYVLGHDESAYESSMRRSREAANNRLRAEADAKAAQETPRRAPTNAYSELAGKTPDEIRAMAPISIPVLTNGGERFPFPADQFTLTQPDKCQNEHYHAAVGYTLELKRVPEPPVPCGFDNAVTVEEVDVEKLIKWMQEGPKAQKR